MATITTTNRARYQAAITRLEANIAIVQAGMADFGLEKSWELDTGAGKQKVSYRSVDEMIKALNGWESLLGYYHGKLAGFGAVQMRMERAY